MHTYMRIVLYTLARTTGNDMAHTRRRDNVLFYLLYIYVCLAFVTSNSRFRLSP